MMTPSGGYRPLCLVVSCAWAMVARESCGGCARGVTEAVAMREMMTTTITIWMLSEAAVLRRKYLQEGGVFQWKKLFRPEEEARLELMTDRIKMRTIFAYKSWTVIGVQSQAVITIASKN
uniref:Secreted protein n=1 Tax=Oryza nivara TaxID=4536 RepID=A0A0E0GP28_ORYNI